MAKREMVSVILFEDGTYEVHDIDPEHATQHLIGSRYGKSCEIYHCLKSNWKQYLLKLLDTKKIDRQITELEKRKKKLLALKSKIEKEINHA